MKVAVDTSVLLLMLTRAAGDADERAAAQALLTRRGKLWVPMVVLGETLCALPDDVRQRAADALARDDRLLAYDAGAAVWTGRLGAPKATPRAPRQAVKWDHAIAATCVRHRVTTLCTLDDDFIALFQRLGVDIAVVSPSVLAAA